MDFLLAATFKSNKTQAEIDSWLKSVSPAVRAVPAQVLVAPSFPYLDLVGRSSEFVLTAQDVSPFPPGSYTGEVNATQLADLRVRFCLIGHSERRRYFHETHSEIANKADLLLQAGITPILCLSEADISPQLAALPAPIQPNIVYCFEPPADIGGTETAPHDEIGRVLERLRGSLGPAATLMYGGSVNAANLGDLLSLDLGGVLVSTASLDPADFIAVIKTLVALRT